MKRRGFLGRLIKGAGAAAALVLIPACDSAGGAAADDDLSMHGPVRIASEVLQLPVAESALALFAPYTDGKPFSRGWSIAHVAKGHDDQIMLVVVDLETGGHAELEIWRVVEPYRPVGQSRYFGVYLDNAGHGDVHTPRHLERLCQAVADVVKANEEQVTLDWDLPSIATKVDRERHRRGLIEQAPTGDPEGEPTGEAVGDPTGDTVGDPTGDPIGDPIGDGPDFLVAP